jgi:hypothetical protein
VTAPVDEPITAEAVLDLFRAAWPRAKQYPDPFWCGHIAIALRVVRDRRTRRTPPKPAPVEAVGHGRRFLEHAPDMRAQLENEAIRYFHVDETNGGESKVFLDRARHDRCIAALAALEEAQRAVRAALDAWEVRDPFYIEPQDPARFIWSTVQRALQASDCAVPRSVQNDDDPMCNFVAAALKLAGVLTKRGTPPSPAAISKVLSGKNQRLSRASRH